MHIQKFEAKTMKEALEMVKVSLGPEAIILSAKDNSSNFGLLGNTSVEITAAVSEKTIEKRRLAEAKIKPSLREEFRRTPARVQKEFIDQAVEREALRQEADRKRNVHQFTKQSYIDIDEQPMPRMAQPRAQTQQSAMGRNYNPAGRIQNQAPRQAMPQAQVRKVQAPSPQGMLQATQQQQESVQLARAQQMTAEANLAKIKAIEQAQSQEVIMLKNEVQQLRGILEKFNSVPQNFITAHPGAHYGLSYEMSSVFQKMVDRGLSEKYVADLLKLAQTQMDKEQIKKPSYVEGWMIRYLLGTVSVADTNARARYHVFVGATGQGKTTTLVKMAAQMVLEKRSRIAIVSLDTLKVGATEQLKIFAKILNVPYAVVRSAQDWVELENHVENVDTILVDAAGMNLQTQEQVDWLRSVLPPEGSRRTHLVQSILSRDEEIFELTRKYLAFGIDDVLFTRLDEASRCGVMINWMDHFRKPVFAFGTGTQIPEDFEWATKERVVDFVFRISNLRKDKGDL